MWLRVALVLVVVGVGCVTMTPILEMPNEDICPSRTSCQVRDDITLAEEPCYCDVLCNTYADCCYDYEFINASLQKIDEATDLRCYSFGNHQLYVKTRCKEGWTDIEVEDLCVQMGVNTDPLSSLPVTSNTTGYTYPNYYCAICNEDILDFRMWNAALVCDGLTQRDDIDPNDLVFRNNSWGVLQGTPELPDFRKCSVSPQRPNDVKDLTRSCYDSINTCSEDWEDEEVALQCQSYTFVVYSSSAETSYRNPYCAVCNKNHDYICAPSEPSIRFPEFEIIRSFALLFDFTDPSSSNLVGSSSPCNATQVWDPFFKRCRSIVCPKPNQDYRSGRCVALGNVNSMEGSELTATPTTNTTTEATAAAAIAINNNESNIIKNTSDSPNNNNSNTTTTTINNSTNDNNNNNTTTNSTNNDNNNNNTTTITTTNSTNDNNNTTTITSDTLPPNTTTSPPSTTSPMNTPSTQRSLGIFPEDRHPIIFPRESTEPPTTPTQQEEDEIPTTPSIEDIPTSPPPNTPSPEVSTHTAPTRATTPLLPDTHSTLAPDAALSTNFSSEFAECYKVILLEGEFVDLPNNTVYVVEYDRTYSPGEYSRITEGLLVCLPDTSSSRKFSAALGWVSLAGLGLSCTSLLLHLAAFTLLPELRNLSGRNLASLCLALLAAYITFLVNMLMQPDPAGCVTLAAAMYYFFVTSFTWMNVIAFDVWYTFRLTQRQLRVSSGDQWHRFIAYSLYSWLLPAAATLTLVLVDQLEPSGVPEEFLPRLGATWCWFAHRKALLVFFAAPMVTIIVMNCIFFVSAAAIITQTSSTAAAASARGNHPQGQYKMYLRLAVLMGFTWVSGIVAGYLDLEALWYVFVVLNTLQGVFIFLAFTFRTRVWKGVGTTFRKLMQRGLSKLNRRPQPLEIRAFELSHTPEDCTTNSYSSPNTSLAVC